MIQSLLEGRLVTLTALEPERDAEILAKWTHDADYMLGMSAKPMRPLSPTQVRKQLEAWKAGSDHFRFGIRTRVDDRLVGLAEIHWVEWPNGAGGVRIGIGDSKDRGCGFGRDALNLLLRYAFHELNLYRLSANVPEFNQIYRNLLEDVGFIVEVRVRKQIFRSGRWWDSLFYGLLAPEWAARQNAEAGS